MPFRLSYASRAQSGALCCGLRPGRLGFLVHPTMEGAASDKTTSLGGIFNTLGSPVVSSSQWTNRQDGFLPGSRQHHPTQPVDVGFRIQ